MRLPSFHEASHVEPDKSFIDGLDLRLESWSIFGLDSENISNFLDVLGPLRESLVLSEEEPRFFPGHGWLVGRQQRGSKFPVRKRTYSLDSTVIPIPLFGGKLVARTTETPNFEGGGDTLSFRLLGKLNPTRFIRHSKPRNPELRRDGLPSKLFRNDIARNSYEWAFDGNDNWLPQAWRNYPDEHERQTYLEEYLHAVRDEVQAELQKLANHYNAGTADVTPANLFSLWRQETFWDFAADNPLDVVHSLRPAITSFGNGLIRERFLSQHPQHPQQPPPHCFSEIHGGQVSLSIDCGPGEKLSVYAKTNRRVRIEVTHRTSQQSDLVEDHNGSFNHDLFSTIAELQERAAECVNRFLAHKQQCQALPSNFMSPLVFLTRVAAATRGAPIAEVSMILEALVHEGRLRFQGNIPLQAHRERLLQAGVIERRGHGRGSYYVPAPRCQFAIERLQQLPGGWEDWLSQNEPSGEDAN